jgi:RNA polymerase sporulation-specific sigma factor
MRKYNELSDEQLQKLAASGDAGAEEELTDRYTSLVNLCAQPYYLPGGDRADLTQEGMVGLLSAIRKYRQEENVPFRAYAELCIRRRIFSAIRYSSRQKHEPLNTGVSLEESMLTPPRESSTRIVQDQRRVPEEQVLARERAQEFNREFLRRLSSFEQEVLQLYLDGFSYRAMAQMTGREEKAIDNAVQRIRRKLARILPFGENSES